MYVSITLPEWYPWTTGLVFLWLACNNGNKGRYTQKVCFQLCF